MRPLIATFVLSLTVCGVTGCASTGETDDDRTVTIEVEHELLASGPMTVAIQEENGPRRRLGTVSDGEVARFDFRPARGGQYTLLSESRWARPVRSTVFFISDDVEKVVWDMAANHISTN